MASKNNILQLNTIAKQATDANRDKIQDIIDLYINKKIPNSRTALNVAALLASKNKNVIKSGKPDREYYKVMEKYDQDEFQEADITTARTTIQIVIKPKIQRTGKTGIGSERRSISEILVPFKPRMIEEIKKVLVVKRSFKIKLRLKMTIQKRTWDKEGKEEWEERQVQFMNKKISEINKNNVAASLDSQLGELIPRCEAIEQADGASLDSGWIVKTYDTLFIDIFETKPLRASSYIETPEQFKNVKCGFINIQNDDMECFKWCMRYHQTEKKVKDKYDCSVISC